MSDNTRQLTGLVPPRRVDPKKMVARNRAATPTPDPAPEAAAPTAIAEPTVPAVPAVSEESLATETVATAPQAPVDAPERPSKPVEATRASTARKAKPAAPAAAAKDPQSRVNTYIDPDARSRVVAAFRFTSHLEGESSFSEFVETALLNEAIRREEKYNDGEPYAAEVKLQRGRPVRG